MKIWKKLLTSVMTVGLLIGMPSVTAAAESYTYTVTIDAGNQGTVAGTEGLSVTSTSAVVSVEGSKIVIKDLHAKDVVSFNPQSGAIAMADSGKYYIKGIRQSGHDNSEAVASAFTVTEDQDYVVAYGVKGNMVGYTVNYQDAEGNELAPSQTFYGNVGDKPVVAYLYIEGYAPQALALTKTLSENEADNVFTFEYEPGEVQTIITPGETIENIIVEGEDTTGVDGIPAPTTPGGAGTTGTTGAGETGTAQTEGTQEDLVEVEDEEVPQELVDLDDEDVPLANVGLDDEDAKKGIPIAAGIGIAVIAVAALVVLVVFLKKNKTGK